MAIIVEDGSGLSNANSYESVSAFTAYCSDRGITLTGTASALLIRATDIIDSLPHCGMKKTITQSLMYPRVFDTYFTVDGFYVDSTSVPALVKKACIEIAIQLDKGHDVTVASTKAAIKEEIFQGVSVTYGTSASDVQTKPVYDFAMRYLQPFLKPMSIKVGRG